ncbi:DUF354 domain-containing protein [Litoribacter alkaliphilus]|uniref:DUF354 domain-containing protein n=1 Tax=Litoribacter ruber TaxID=702568 RepID=A0AAP2CIF9_9BACT|nr:DUF354 domain-containing protein [Litoribacter alkaliphilus]MBS9524264.1 DUF354 domain-containing protein [Litoribacter alkaliphilus]
MKILIDIKHPAQLNLFKGLSRDLEKEGWEVTICYLERGKLPKIIQREYQGFHTVPVGSSKGTKWSIMWDGNVKRTFTFLNMIRKNKYDICIAASSIPLALAGRLSGVPVIQFYDDPERGKINTINAKLSKQLFFPPIVEKDKKTSIFNCLKEWSYLSPNRFKPDPSILEKYDLKPNEYVFVREVSNKSFNYYDQDDAIVCKFSPKMNPKAKVLLSLEDKTIADKFPKHWTILEEPVGDIHSLIYYSKLVISSGDSMAREGAMLGVPSVYCGIRKMKANELLMGLGLLQHLPKDEAIPFINETIAEKFDENKQEQVRGKLLVDWDDMNVFMKNQINNYKNN